MFDVTFVTSRELAFDGVEYTISVYRRLDGFHSIWECKHCSDQGSPLSPSIYRDAAIANCNQLIELHHTERHSGKAEA
jgi:hypothetical protein